jgi:hypothetical protein
MHLPETYYFQVSGFMGRSGLQICLSNVCAPVIPGTYNSVTINGDPRRTVPGPSLHTGKVSDAPPAACTDGRAQSLWPSRPASTAASSVRADGMFCSPFVNEFGLVWTSSGSFRKRYSIRPPKGRYLASPARWTWWWRDNLGRSSSR